VFTLVSQRVKTACEAKGRSVVAPCWLTVVCYANIAFLGWRYFIRCIYWTHDSLFSVYNIHDYKAEGTIAKVCQVFILSSAIDKMVVVCRFFYNDQEAFIKVTLQRKLACFPIVFVIRNARYDVLQISYFLCCII